MDPIARIQHEFNQSIQTKTASIAALAEPIVKAAQMMSAALQQGHKILVCGNGGSASDAQHFSAELINRYYRERDPLACICLNTDTSTLTSIGNDYHYDLVFSKQVKALGQAGDVLLAISTSGNSANILEAVKVAHERQVRVVALTGNGGGKLNKLLQGNDIHICVPSSITARIQEVHILVIHCLCDFIDNVLLGISDANT